MKYYTSSVSYMFVCCCSLMVDVKVVLVLSGGVQNTKEESGGKGSKW